LPDLPVIAHEGVLGALNDPVVASDRSGVILFLNATAERLLGWATAEIVGKPLTTIIPPRLRPAHEAGFRRFLSTGQSRIMGRPTRVPALARDGSEIDVELTLSELQTGGSGPLIIAILRDLRDRIELERQIDAQRKILAQYATAAVLAGAQDATDAIPEILGRVAVALGWAAGVYWSVDTASGRLRPFATWSSGSDVATRFLEESRASSFGDGEGSPGEVLATGLAIGSGQLERDRRYRPPLGSRAALRSAFLSPVSSPRRTWGVLEFVSEREEEADDELRQTMTVLSYQIGRFFERLEREEQLRRASGEAEAARYNLEQLFHEAPAAIAVIRGPEMRYELSNAANQELAAGRNLVGMTVREGLPELEADGVMAMVGRVYQTGEPFFAREYPVTRPATANRPAQRIFMNGVTQPLRGPGGTIEGVMLFAYEVTDLVASRERVKEAEERLRLAVESARLGTWDYDPNSGVVLCDARYRRLFGLGAEAQLTTRMLAEAIHPEDRARATEAVQRSFDPASGGEYTIEYRTRGIEDRKERWVAMRGRTFFDDRGKPVRFVGTGTDVTDERRALDRLQFLTEASRILASKLTYRETLSQVAQLAILRLADWCAIELVDDGEAPELVALAHVDPARVAAARDLRAHHPEFWQAAAAARVLATGQPQLVEMSDSPEFEVLRPFGLGSVMLLPLVARGRTIGVLTLVQADSGRTFTPEDLGFADELSRRMSSAIENARLYDQAKRAIGVRDQFLSIASHELRTPLTTLTLQLSSFARSFAEGTFHTLTPERLESRVGRMEQQVVRLNGLVDELLDVSRISAGRLAIDRRPSDLVQLVREVIERLGDEASRAGSRIALRAPAALVGLWDPNRLDQVITNLIGNALKYAGGTPVDVEVATREQTAVVIVRDRGPGIADADQERIFEQFERAAPSSMAGLGLGLWIARRLVEAHQGRISVESSPGAGASFVVELPLQPPE
jgi:PAS domain S-box-containing protein